MSYGKREKKKEEIFPKKIPPQAVSAWGRISRPGKRKRGESELEKKRGSHPRTRRRSAKQMPEGEKKKKQEEGPAVLNRREGKWVNPTRHCLQKRKNRCSGGKGEHVFCKKKKRGTHYGRKVREKGAARFGKDEKKKKKKSISDIRGKKSSLLSGEGGKGAVTYWASEGKKGERGDVASIKNHVGATARHSAIKLKIFWGKKGERRETRLTVTRLLAQPKESASTNRQKGRLLEEKAKREDGTSSPASEKKKKDRPHPNEGVLPKSLHRAKRGGKGKKKGEDESPQEGGSFGKIGVRPS